MRRRWPLQQLLLLRQLLRLLVLLDLLVLRVLLAALGRQLALHFALAAQTAWLRVWRLCHWEVEAAVLVAAVVVPAVGALLQQDRALQLQAQALERRAARSLLQ